MALVQNAKLSLSGLFQNLESSPFCARCLLGASQKGIMDAQMAIGFKGFWASITQDLEFWTSFMRFLFTPRTEEQAQVLLDQLSHCSCRMSDTKILGYHRFGKILRTRFISEDMCRYTNKFHRIFYQPLSHLVRVH